MIYNNTLPNEYGTFSEIGDGSVISKNRPTPTGEDYINGYITRYFLKKANENVIIEVSVLSYKNVNQNLYKSVQLKQKISGPKNNIYKENILDKAGVMEQNKFEIDRVKKEEGVDLSATLANLLEYWRGR